MRVDRGLVVGLVLAAVVAGVAIPQEPKPPTPERQAELFKEFARLSEECLKLEQAGKLAEAVAAAERRLVIVRELLGERDPRLADFHTAIGRLHLTREDWTAARTQFRRALDILTTAHGKDDWRVTDARLALADVDRFEKFTPDDRAATRRAEGLNAEGLRQRREGKYAAARECFTQALEIRKRVLGDAHPDTATTLNNLAALHRATGEYAAAEPLYRQALAATRKAVGENHPDTARGLNNLGALFFSTGEYPKAEALFWQAMRIRRKTIGLLHPDTASNLNNLGLVYRELGDYGKAEPLFRLALAARKKALGDAHPDTADSLNNLALVYHDTGEYAKAAELYQQALAVTRQTLGEKHPDFALVLCNLADVYRDTGEYGKAEPLLKQALTIREAALGKDHPAYAQSLNNLGMLYQDTTEYAKAEGLFRQALEIKRRSVGENHPSYATSLDNLAGACRDTGDYAQAEQLLNQAVDVRRKALGDAHADTAASYYHLAELHAIRGQPAKAEPLYKKALNICLDQLDRTADVQPEQWQITFASTFQSALAGYLTATSAGGGRGAADAYVLALRWKGQVFVRQRRRRELARAAADPATARLAADLLAATRQLAAVAGQTPPPDQADGWKKQLADLEAEREQREQALIAASNHFGQQKARETLAPDRLQQLLPPKTALVDFFVYSHFTPDPKAKRGGSREDRLAAFVARPDREVARVELGPFEPIREAVEAWRKDTTRRRPVRGDDDPAAVLRDRLWQPVAKHLGGTDTALISPDRDLARLPFGALPGATEGNYLVEELAVAVLPVPQFLPDVVAPPPAAAPSLLVVGEVDYGADPGKPTGGIERREHGGNWKPLPATREEVTAVRGAFGATFPNGSVRVLRAGEPTEDAIRGLLGRHRWVHLATHGFFTDPTARAAAGRRFEADRGRVVGQLPGLLSGVVLAGANRPVDPLSGADDGILTAAEVTTLDLSGTEVVVLSACETGLGQVAGGEGVLGLQRAFQVAGCRTTVTSLWSVPDDATRALMTRAYANWWGGTATKLGGLVEAQRRLIRAGLPAADGRPAVRTPTPPFYWAAFTLAGDWR